MPPKSAVTVIAERPTAFELLPLDQVDESPRNPRKHVDKRALEELTESIQTHGVIEPILVRPHGNRFEIVAGARRLRASLAAGKTEIPALVREMDESEALEVGVIENLQREDVHPLEEAEGYEQFLEQKERPCTVDELAAKVGKSKAYIYARLKLTALCPAARSAFYADAFGASIALLVARIPDPELQRKALKELQPRFGDSEPLSFRQAARVIHERFMLKLSGAPFQASDPDLVPSAGACSSCPKRTGAQPELFDDVGNADVCTDLNCYQVKVDALWKRKVGEAKAAGREVIEDKKAKEFFEDRYGIKDSSLRYDSGYVELSRTCDEDPKRRDYRRLFGKHAQDAIVLARDPEGRIRELVPRGEVKKLLRAAGHDFRVERTTSPKASPAELAATKKERQRRIFEDAVEERIALLVGQAIDANDPDREIWDIALEDLLDTMYGDADHVLERRFGPEGLRAFERARPAMTEVELRAIVLDMQLSTALGAFKGKLRDRLLVWAGIDRKAIEAEVKAEFAATEKTKPEDEGAEKAKPAKKRGRRA